MNIPEVGTTLPEVSFPITPFLVVAGAIATRDFQPVHHDRDAAQAAGAKDIFMNILTTNGLVGRYVTDWAGPNAHLRRVSIRLGTPNFPGDTMTMTGSVTDTVGDRGRIVSISGTNSLGMHVSGTVEIELAKDVAPA